MKNIHRLTISAAAILLTACGGSNNTVIPPEPEPEPITEPPQVTSSALEGALVQAGAVSVEQFLKNGLYASTINQFVTLDAAPVSEAASSGASGNFSTTNTQEQGVDEADRIEYDGDFMYVATYPVWLETGEVEASVRVLQRNQDFSLTEVNNLPLVEENANVQGLYHSNDRLAVVGSNFQMYTLEASFFGPWQAHEPKVSVSIYDTQDPSAAATLTDIQIDGWLLSSRRIEDQLYLVSSYIPSIESLEVGASDEETMLQNYLTILDTPINDLMPQIYQDGTSQALNEAADCYIPELATELDGYAQLVTVTRISLTDPTDNTSSCMSLLADTMYMSEHNLYLASGFNDSTVLHKIALDEAISYQASGEVRGILGWNNPNLRLSEKDGYLRMVTSYYGNFEDPEHYLSVLQQTGAQLDVVASLPNEQQPEPIGKPNEDIFAVRFFGDKGYIVTFERIDPLYVLDLSDPVNPLVAGSLEIPGFSSYLQPIEDNYVLGVGQEVEFVGTPATGENIDLAWIVPPITTTGVKVSLFDVRDPANPLAVGNIVKEGSYTPVEYDYRALSVLNNAGTYQFAMPLERWGQVTDDGVSSYFMPNHSLLMMEVDTATASLVEIGEVSAQNDSDIYVFGGEDRSVLHDNHVFYLHGNQVWHAIWQADSAVDGPY